MCNKVLLLGNLTRDPELRHTNGGTAVTDLGLAVNEKRKNDKGEQVEETLFADVTVWGKNAENCSKYLAKGSQIFVEGKLKLDSWETEEGEKRNKMRVVAEKVQFLGGKRKAEGEVVAATADDTPF